MSKDSIELDALTTIKSATGKIKKEQDGTNTGILTLTTDLGPRELTLDQFDGIYRGFVICWPAIKPLKDQIIVANREATKARKEKEREEAKVAKQAEKEAARKKREEEVAAKKKEKDEAAAKAKADREAKAKADKEAKLKADKEKAKKAADAKAKQDKGTAAKK